MNTAIAHTATTGTATTGTATTDTADVTIQLAIKGSAEQIWQTLVDGEITPLYYVGFAAEFDLTAGAPYRYTAGGGDMITGTVVEVDPGRKLVTTFRGFWHPTVAELPDTTRLRSNLSAE